MKGAWLYNVRAAIWGGNFNNGAIAGVFYLNLNNAPSNANYNIGFRACKAQDFRPDAQEGSWAQCIFALES
jgi:hypothetical protein